MSEVDETGRKVNTTFDVLDRRELEVIVGSTAAGVGDIARHYSYSTAATSCGCTAAAVLIQNADGSSPLTTTPKIFQSWLAFKAPLDYT